MRHVAHVLPFVVRPRDRWTLIDFTRRIDEAFRLIRMRRVRRALSGEEIDPPLEKPLAWYLDDATGEPSADACGPGREVQARLVIRAKRLHEARLRSNRGLPRPSDFKSHELDMIDAASRGVEVRGVVSEHRSDEIAAALHGEFPWLAEATARLMRAQRRRSRDGLGFRLDPLILVGPPGTGKSTWARRVADLYGVPSVDIDVGATGGAVMGLAGVERGWGSARPGAVVQAVLGQRVANPLVIIDELNLGDEMVTTSGGAGARSGSRPGLFAVLLGMLEAVTARAWVCPYYGVPIDLTGVSWVMTANSLTGIPAPLLNRCTVIRVDALSPAELVSAARASCEGLDPETAQMVAAAVEGAARAGRRLTLRDVAKAVKMAEAVCGAEIAH